MRQLVVSPRLVALILFIILAAHTIGIFEGWQRALFWFPVSLHFIGGFWLALFAAWRLSLLRDISFARIPGLFILVALLSFAALAGAGWELFEFSVDRFFELSDFRMQPSLDDTMGDLAFDLLGAFVGFCAIWFMARSRFSRAS